MAKSRLSGGIMIMMVYPLCTRRLGARFSALQG